MLYFHHQGSRISQQPSFQHLELSPELDKPSQQTSQEWALKLQTSDNWAKLLNQLSQLPESFRDEVFAIWETSVFGGTDFPIVVMNRTNQNL